MVNEHFLSTCDADEWRRCLPASRSIFGSLGYARICENFRGVSPRLHVLESETGSICYPMLLRPLRELPFPVSPTAQWDSASPDYTGPIVTGCDEDLNQAFTEHRHALTRDQGIVSEFAHLHPWSGTMPLLGEGCSYNREIVWIDLSLTLDELYRDHLGYGCRKNIQKAEREGVRIVAGTSDEDLKEFFRIYTGTMQRNQALDRYAFSLDFFRAFRSELPDNARFAFAVHESRIIAATLYLHDTDDVFSFLGGADVEFNQLRPSNLMIWETVCWAHAQGKKRLVLGGGYGPDDGIFRFKQTFSRLKQDFFVYRQKNLVDEYARLEQCFRVYSGLKDEHVDYFPSYRADKS